MLVGSHWGGCRDATKLNLAAEGRGRSSGLVISNLFEKSVYFKHVVFIFFSPRYASVQILTLLKKYF